MSEIKTKLVIRALIGAIMGMLISLFICTFLNDLSELAKYFVTAPLEITKN